MDKDTIRRSMPTQHSQYEQVAAAQKGKDVAHFGTSQSINLGNLCYFLGFRLLAESSTSIVHFISQELSAVTLAQMQDVAGGHLNTAYSRENILYVYRYKTARYTFSMPLLVGGMLAKTPKTILDSLSNMGESMGLLYQIRDDELNATGTVASVGKSVGGDAELHKQTLRAVLSASQLTSIIRDERVAAQSIIRSLPVSPKKQQELTRLLRFCQTRRR